MRKSHRLRTLNGCCCCCCWVADAAADEEIGLGTAAEVIVVDVAFDDDAIGSGRSDQKRSLIGEGSLVGNIAA